MSQNSPWVCAETAGAELEEQMMGFVELAGEVLLDPLVLSGSFHDVFEFLDSQQRSLLALSH